MRRARAASDEGLGDDVHPRLEVAVADGRGFGVAGDEEHRQPRPEKAARVRHLPPVQASGQAHVGDEQVDAPFRAQECQPGRAVRRLDGIVAQFLQHLAHQHPHR